MLAAGFAAGFASLVGLLGVEVEQRDLSFQLGHVREYWATRSASTTMAHFWLQARQVKCCSSSPDVASLGDEQHGQRMMTLAMAPTAY